MKHAWSDYRNRMDIELVDAELKIRMNSDYPCAYMYKYLLSQPDILNKIRTNEKYQQKKRHNNDALEHAQYMIRNIQLENEVVHMEANTTGWRKANTSDISSIITSYNENDVKQCSGEYSVRIAHAYSGHIQQQWSTYIHLDFPSTIKIKNIISRYKTTDNPKKHTVWIRFGHNKLHDIASYCTCKSSLRTAGGTCSHVIAALIALNYWKNNKKKASFYTTAAALFLNVLDCTTYKKSKMEQALEEYYGESSDTES
ncbi:unnamed protein product [Rotaria sordida]|uniref:SWIM-type domain-containing protein n=2 Tax=Rotaria sordida TaxID=392033 RepID=A0A819X680_9BILA|nr:unnamed protein product [Rotaria sordida]